MVIELNKIMTTPEATSRPSSRTGQTPASSRTRKAATVVNAETTMAGPVLANVWSMASPS